MTEPTDIYGVDYTCAMGRSKPNIVCHAQLTGNALKFRAFIEFRPLATFEDWLLNLQSGIVGIDAPFGLPLEFATHLHSLSGALESPTWTTTAEHLSQFEMRAYEFMVKAFRDSRPKGNKEPRRAFDITYGGASPIKLYNPPVGRMLFRLTPVLANSTHSLWPMRLSDSPVMIVEVYPAIIPKRLLGGKSYKNDPMGEQERPKNRQRILDFLTSSQVENVLGYRLSNLSEEDTQLCVQDRKGDRIDALIAAFEAAGAARLAKLPTVENPHEGEIFTVLPALQAAGVLPQKR